MNSTEVKEGQYVHIAGTAMTKVDWAEADIPAVEAIEQRLSE